MGQKAEEAAVGRPPESSQEWDFPSGKFWLVFLILAILQSDYFVLFAVFSDPEQIRQMCSHYNIPPFTFLC